jgi:outer membrane receptor protein involved in Fe transport
VQDPGCVPINFLLPGAALTEAQLNWIRIPFATETAELRQLVGSASVTGDLIELWAGSVSIAVGTEWREEKSVYLTSDVDQQGLGFFNTRRQSTRGQFDVLEFFGEAIIPVLRDLPFAESAEIELAVRRSDYSTAGVTYAWKAGANWSPVRDIRFRGVLARAVRAPNVGELFSPASEGFLTVDDPCDVNFITGGTGGRASTCSALGVPAGFISNARTINIRTATAGNPELDVEKADTLTLGVVLAPRFVPGLSITADYYDIKIEDAINVFSAQDILNNCVDIGSIDNPFCQSISRAPGGAITQIRRQSINVSEFHREGIDVELRYRLDFEEAGVFDLSVAANRALAVETIVAPGTLTGGTTIDELGEIGNPKWKARAAGRYTLGGLTFNATVNYLSSMVRDVQPVQPEDNRATTPTGDFWLTDLQVGYDLFEETNVFFGVDNVFDRQPPSLPETRAGGAGSFEGAEIYPTMGRYFYVGARTKF